jgi:hypothetical protein
MDKGLKLGEVARRMLDMVDLLGEMQRQARAARGALVGATRLRARHLRTSGADRRDSGTDGDTMRFMLGGMLVHPRYCHLSCLESPMVFAAAPLALGCCRPWRSAGAPQQRPHKPAVHGLLKEPMMLDLLITHASLPDGRCDMSVAVQGRIVEVAPGLHAPAHETVDARASC